MGRKFVDQTGIVYGDFEIISFDHYSGKHKYWNVECIKCGSSYTVRMDGLQTKKFKCACCGTGNINYLNQRLVGEQFGYLYVISIADEYKHHKYYLNRNNHQVKWKCICKCGNETTVSQAHLLSGHSRSCGCMRPQSVAKIYTKNLVGQRFGSLVVESQAPHIIYKERKYVAWNCRCDCGNSTIVPASNLHNRTVKSCGCVISSAEAQIIRYFQKHKISYDKQIAFDQLKDKKPLRFDFGIYDSNHSLLVLIQYDGIQHFIPQKWTSDWNEEQILEHFYETKKHDNMKNEFCKSNNIPLIRIPYTQRWNIEQILNSTLPQYGVKYNEVDE